MKIALISDIHSNAVALSAVAKHIKNNNCDKIICLGDTVGYGPHPSQCWNWIKKYCTVILKGNHEDCVCDSYKELNMNRYAIEGCRFARLHMESEKIDELQQLPTKVVMEEHSLTICHGSFSEPCAWTYIDNPESAETELELVGTRLCAVGHTHCPFVFRLGYGLYEYIPNNMLLKSQYKYLINVGSVGQPRDGDCRSAYVTLEYNENDKDADVILNLHRVFYDVAKVDAFMEKCNISSFLGDRLYRGE